MFVDLMDDIRRSVGSLTYRAQLGPPAPRVQSRMTLSGPGSAGARAAPAGPGSAGSIGGRQAPTREDAVVAGLGGGGTATATRRMTTNRREAEAPANTPVSVDKEPGRNDPCPCGSGKKYKKCHGAVG
jgi:hypothetical protein